MNNKQLFGTQSKANSLYGAGAWQVEQLPNQQACDNRFTRVHELFNQIISISIQTA